jgi:hypothetical protein
LFAFFAKHETASVFAQSKFKENSDPKFGARMTQEIELLCKEALNSLRVSNGLVFQSYFESMFAEKN